MKEYYWNKSLTPPALPDSLSLSQQVAGAREGHLCQTPPTALSLLAAPVSSVVHTFYNSARGD